MVDTVRIKNTIPLVRLQMENVQVSCPEHFYVGCEWLAYQLDHIAQPCAQSSGHLITIPNEDLITASAS